MILSLHTAEGIRNTNAKSSILHAEIFRGIAEFFRGIAEFFRGTAEFERLFLTSTPAIATVTAILGILYLFTILIETRPALKGGRSRGKMTAANTPANTNCKGRANNERSIFRPKLSVKHHQ